MMGVQIAAPSGEESLKIPSPLPITISVSLRSANESQARPQND